MTKQLRRLDRQSAATALALSVIALISLSICYGMRPDQAAALTVFPVWVWPVPGLLLVRFAWRPRQIAATNGRLRDAFREGGFGWGNTVANDVPVLRIDQIWISDRFHVAAVRAHRTRGSDHRLVVCDLWIDEKPVARH